ncbi:MAG: hypothetical protein RSD14_05815 [Clostridia bacterium]
MINKKSLYEVKLILDYLSKEELAQIPKEVIDFIEDNFEYDENVVIDPKKNLTKQNLNKETFKMLDKIIKEIENNCLKTSNNIEEYNINTNNNKEKKEYIAAVKKDNKYRQTDLDNFKLKAKVDELIQEKNKLYKAKDLLEQYNEKLKSCQQEISNLKEINNNYQEYIDNIPRIVKKIFIKNKNELKA